MVRPEKWEELRRRMQKLGIQETDLTEKFILGTGRGGQNLHKTASCVYLKHHPTEIEVKCQHDRSREVNRFVARRALCEKIESRVLREKTALQQAIAKKRRQKQRRRRRVQQQVLAGKKRRSEVKAKRALPPSE